MSNQSSNRELNIGYVTSSSSSSSSSSHEKNMASLRIDDARPVLVFFITPNNSTAVDRHTDTVMAAIKV